VMSDVETLGNGHLPRTLSGDHKHYLAISAQINWMWLTQV